MMQRRRPNDEHRHNPLPRRVRGGIKAQESNGAFASTWWGRRWIETLESFSIGARLARGKSYARLGQVVSLTVEKGEVRARVQGSRSNAYTVTIRLAAFTPQQWHKIVLALTEKPLFAARLLANDMPEDMEALFRSAGLALFPRRHQDLDTKCSCPDWSNPCKHIAAVYYLLAGAFDTDPFLLFRLRGMDRTELLDRLRGSGPLDQRARFVPDTAAAPLPARPEDFWTTPSDDDTLAVPNPAPPALHAAIPKRLGNLPFWRSDNPFLAAMEALYRNASDYAISIIERGEAARDLKDDDDDDDDDAGDSEENTELG